MFGLLEKWEKNEKTIAIEHVPDLTKQVAFSKSIQCGLLTFSWVQITLRITSAAGDSKHFHVILLTKEYRVWAIRDVGRGRS